MKRFWKFVNEFFVFFLGIVFSLYFFIKVKSLPTISGGYPRALALIVLLLSVWILVNQIWLSKKPENPESTSIGELLRPIKVLLFLFVYICLIPYIGFYVSSFLFMFFAMMVIERDDAQRNIIKSLLVCVPIVLVIYGVFGFFLKITTPAGILF